MRNPHFVLIRHHCRYFGVARNQAKGVACAPLKSGFDTRTQSIVGEDSRFTFLDVTARLRPTPLRARIQSQSAQEEQNNEDD